MIATFVPLPMYDFPELAGAHARLWKRITARARRRGFAGDVPLTQTCGYPLASFTWNEYDVVGAPVYDVPFSTGSTHRALIIVARNSRYVALEDLRGARFALNAPDSNTGMNLPRRLFAPLARDGRFFGKVVTTGSHLASLAALAAGHADAASIDNVTFALLSCHRPAAVAGLRILTATAPSPTLPFVTPCAAGSRTRVRLYDALASAIEDERRSGAGNDLFLAGIERASLQTYQPLLRYERKAAALGYEVLA